MSAAGSGAAGMGTLRPGTSDTSGTDWSETSDSPVRGTLRIASKIDLPPLKTRRIPHKG